jgi:hypothetical protein
MKRFFVLCSPGLIEGTPVYGGESDEHRFGHAWWAGNKYELHVRRIDERRRVYSCHREELKVAIPSPSAVGDFVWTWYSECLVTQKVLYAFRGNDLTGYVVRPLAHVRFKRESKRKKTDVPTLWELEVFGDGGPPSKDSGSIRLTEPDDIGISKYSSWKSGLLVDEQAWDGSDFFTLDGWRRYIIVSERVKDLIVREHFSNCALVPVENIRWPSTSITPEEMLRMKESGELKRIADEMKQRFSKSGKSY